jgi:hypothetical protein
MQDLQEIQFDNDSKFVSFDNSNIYTNMPTNKLTKIIQHMCTHNDINITLQNKLLQQCDTVLNQNYFNLTHTNTFKNKGWLWVHPPHPFSQGFIFNT